MICVYSITNIISGRRYVGSSVEFDRRKSEHIAALNAGTHSNTSLQEDFNILGIMWFRFDILCEVFDEAFLEEREQFFLDNSIYLYNHQTKAHCIPRRPAFNVKMKQVMASPEIRDKISRKMKDHFSNPANVEKMRAAVTTPEVTEKKRQAALRNHQDPSYIEKRNAGLNKRKKETASK